MIQSILGEVKITRPNYELCNILKCTKEDVDEIVEASLCADLTEIVAALDDIYVTERAMKMWTRSAEVYIETLKGE